MHLDIVRLPMALAAVFALCICVYAENGLLATDFRERGEIALNKPWQIQPASSSSETPAEDRWGATKSATGDWRRRGGLINSTGTSWERTPPHRVNSLWYQQSASIPADWRAKTVMLSFECIEGDAIVFLNGKRIGEVLQPGGEIEVTESANCGEENQLRIFLTRDYTDMSRGFEEDPLRFLGRTSRFGAIPVHSRPLGLTGAVSLKSYPKLSYISDVFAIPSWREKKISFQLETKAKQAMKDIVYRATILDAEGKKALSFESKPVKVDAGVSTTTIESPWRNPQTWELDRGYLYTAQIEIVQDGKVIDRHPPVTFGFREVWTEGNKLLLNGHPIRLRLSLNCGISADSLPFFRMLGFNATYQQNHPSAWWRNWGSSVVRLNRETLEACDRNGFAFSAPGPNIYHIREKLIDAPEVAAAYEREMAWHIRQYRNHPSILFWTVGMNAYNPRGAIAPQGMGRRAPESSSATMPKVIEKACAIGREIDPTRLYYSHADGNHGDISSANMYLNFAPLQEREEWPMQWAESGDMPYMAVEFGPPYGANFWKGKRAFITEYTAMLLGEKAYLAETEAALAKTLEYSVANKGHGALKNAVKDMYPAYWDFLRLVVRNTNRAYRTWGFNGGWAYWDFGPFGNPPGFDPKNNSHRFGRYRLITEAPTDTPAWVSQGFEIYQQANQPLLAYIAGAPRHTDKTHSYYSGEKIDKNIALVWDGPGSREVTGNWVLREDKPGSKTIRKESIRAKLRAGDITFTPVTFKAAQVSRRTTYVLELFLSKDATETLIDSFPFAVFPELEPVKQVSGKVALYDPAGKSADWLTSLGLKFSNWEPGDSPEGIEFLILGRESLKPGGNMPFADAHIAAGLKVLVLEQLPIVWKGLGLRTQPIMPRRGFKGVGDHPLFAGLDPDDLVNWRGSPDLLPAGKNQPADTRHAPKWSNTHAISSVLLQCPRNAGFTPLVRTSFDLDYSPLLQWTYGKGGIWFCSLDLTGRVGRNAQGSNEMTDPAASLLARNLFDHIQHYRTPAPDVPKLYVDGGVETVTLLNRLGVATDASRPTADTADLIVVGPDGKLTAEALETLAQAGAMVLVLPQKVEAYPAHGLATANDVKYRATPVSHPLFAGIGPNLLRWRAPLEIPVIENAPQGTDILGDGLFALRECGKGKILFVQVLPSMLLEKYAGDNMRAQAVQTGVWRLEQLLAQLLTNLGAPVDREQARRLAFLDLGPQYQVIRHWNMLGPFFVDEEDGEKMLAETFPGEETAIAGDFNPNNTFRRKDGRMLDWRTTAQADEKGFINLGAALKRDTLAVAYGIAVVTSETEREAVLRLGADWRMMAWVNGEPVFKTLHGHNKAGAYKVKVKLKKGENLVSVKVASGSKGFGFWADLATEAGDGAIAISEDLKDVSFYGNGKLADEFDPFEYHYW